MDRLDIYRKAYEFEIGRKKEAEENLTFVTSVVVIVCTAISYILLNSYNLDVKFRAPIYVITFFVAIFISGTIFFTFRSIFNFEWGYLSHPRVMEKYYLDLVDYCKEYSISDENYPDSEFNKYVLDQYISHASRNGYNNDRRSYFIHISKFFIIAVVGFTVLDGCVFLFAGL